MKKNYFYPAIFEPDTEEGGYVISFPDLPDVNTEGDNVADALSMAKEALGAYVEMCLDAGDKLPEPSDPGSTAVPEGGFTSLIELDMLQFRMQYRSKAVKKTLTIPEWLNHMAEARSINFSATLQTALRAELGLK